MTDAARPLAPSLETVARGRLCAGCGGCAALAAPGKIEMETTEEGLLRPRQTAALTAEEDRRVAALCPGLEIAQTAPSPHPLWGPVRSLRAGWAADPDIRWRGASGGALSALLIHQLKTGAAEFVVHIAASNDDPMANRTVISRSAEEIVAGAGSRYAPSQPLEALAGDLPEGRGVFVGKPCDVAALRAAMRGRPDLAAKFPLLVSFFCGGVPALAGAREVARRMGLSPEEVSAFRYRGRGWPGVATATGADGEERTLSYAESWGDVLSRHVQWRCKICPDGVGGLADVVCADAWHCDAAGYPLFEDADGRSLVLARTEAGEAAAAAAVADGALETAPMEIGAIDAMQPGQRKRIGLALSRLTALALSGTPRPRFPGFPLAAAARWGGVLGNLRSFLGALRRVRAHRRRA